MGSRQHPKPHQRADKHGSTTGKTVAQGQSRDERRTLAEEQRREEEATLQAARGDEDVTLPGEELAAQREGPASGEGTVSGEGSARQEGSAGP